jgi:predicted AlkP superfamily phosphohydrolase/phosphomutase
LGVPQTYPVNPVRGIMIAGLLADELNTRSVFPANMIETIRKKVPDYRFDIENFRNSAKDTLLKQIYKISRARFKLARYLLDTAAWDSFIFIETALDRLQHAFWQFLDPESINFEANSRYENVILKYYQYIDFEIGTLLKRFDTNTDILIVSDHGAKAFKGGFCINQWLIDNGYLKLKGEINDITGLKPDMIDWKKTKIWAEGGYYARCFFNIKDREEKGIVEKKDTGALKNELKTRLSIIKTRDGRILNNKILFPEDLYHKVTNAAPDALVYAGSLDYRAIGTIGRDDWITEENDSGPDGANHDYEGVFVMHGPGIQSAKAAGCNILDIAPTLLHRMNIQIPSEMHGKIIK